MNDNRNEKDKPVIIIPEVAETFTSSSVKSYPNNIHTENDTEDKDEPIINNDICSNTEKENKEKCENKKNKKDDEYEEEYEEDNDDDDDDDDDDEKEEEKEEEDDDNDNDEIMNRFDGIPKFDKKRTSRQSLNRFALKTKRWCTKKINTRPLINLVFQFMEFMVIIAGFACFRLSVISILPVLFSLLLIATIAAKNVCKHNHNGICHDLCYALELFIMLLGVPVFFFSIQKAVRRDELYDSTFVKADDWLLGWLFPEGQLALWADSTSWIHPETVLGKLLTEFLAIVYFGYYAYLYVVPLCLGLKFFWYVHQVYDNHVARRRQIAHTIQEAKHFVVAFTLCYTLTMILNAALPGKSPRIYLKEQYAHELTGVALAKGLSTMSQDDTTAATFPSGHVALTTTATVMLLFVWYPYVETPLLVCIVVPVLMSLATLYLRYHYAVDVVVGLWIAAVSCAVSILSRRRNGDNGVHFERVSVCPPRNVKITVFHFGEEKRKTKTQRTTTNVSLGS